MLRNFAPNFPVRQWVALALTLSLAFSQGVLPGAVLLASAEEQSQPTDLVAAFQNVPASGQKTVSFLDNPEAYLSQPAENKPVVKTLPKSPQPVFSSAVVAPKAPASKPQESKPANKISDDPVAMLHWAKPTTNKAATTATSTAAKPSAAKSVSAPVAKGPATPAAQGVSKSVEKSVTQPASKPVANTASKAVAHSVVAPTKPPAASPQPRVANTAVSPAPVTAKTHTAAAKIPTPNVVAPSVPAWIATPAEKITPVFSPVAQADAPDFKLPVDAFIKGSIEAQADEVNLTVGKAKVINLKSPASRVSISNPNIASVVVISPTQVQLNGVAVGVTNLLVWDEKNADRYATFDISVQRDVSMLARQMAMIDPSLQVLPMAAEDSVILTGTANTREQAQLAVDLAKAYFSVGGGSAAPAAPSPASAGGGGNSGAATSTSLSPGSATPGAAPNILNLIQIRGEASTKVETVRRKLQLIDPNIHLDVAPGQGGAEKAILTGRVRSAAVVSQAINLASVFYGQPGIKVITGPGGNAVRAEAGNDTFHTPEAFGNNLDVNILQGSVVSDTSGNVISLMEVAYRPQIRCRVKVLDVSRTALKQLGHNYVAGFNDIGLGSFSGSRAPANGAPIATLDPTDSGSFLTQTRTRALGLPKTGTSTFASGVNPIFGDGVTQFLTLGKDQALALSALVENRKARSLAEPTLVALSGEKASFLAGGEIPIPVSGNNGQISVEFHEFGIRLNLLPTVKDDGKIHLQVAPEVSTVDPANAVITGFVTLQAFATRRFQTTVELESGQSFIMAGLFNQEETDSVSKFPGVGSLPIIGAFFRNKFTDRRDRELVVIIQPDVVSLPPSPASALNDPQPRLESPSGYPPQTLPQQTSYQEYDQPAEALSKR